MTAAPAKEHVLHIAVAKLLSEHCLPTWRWTHFPAGGHRNAITGAQMKRSGLQKGWPDLILIAPSGIIHCLELKRLGEKLRRDQEAFRLWCIQRGIPHAVVHTIDEALVALDDWCCIRIKLPPRAIAE